MPAIPPRESAAKEPNQGQVLPLRRRLQNRFPNNTLKSPPSSDLVISHSEEGSTDVNMEQPKGGGGDLVASLEEKCSRGIHFMDSSFSIRSSPSYLTQ